MIEIDNKKVKELREWYKLIHEEIQKYHAEVGRPVKMIAVTQGLYMLLNENPYIIASTTTADTTLWGCKVRVIRGEGKAFELYGDNAETTTGKYMGDC
jgi:hypothetical protein